MAVARAGLLEPLYEIPFEVDQRALVVGGGMAGMTAALNLADQGFETFLIERSPINWAEWPGGSHRTLEGVDVQAISAARLIQRVVGHPGIRLFTETESAGDHRDRGPVHQCLFHRGEKGIVGTRGRGGGHRRPEYKPTEYPMAAIPGF